MSCTSCRPFTPFHMYPLLKSLGMAQRMAAARSAATSPKISALLAGYSLVTTLMMLQQRIKPNCQARGGVVGSPRFAAL